MERYFASHFLLTLAWSLAVLLGLVGLGRVVARATKEEADIQAGWGLHAAWGMSLYLFVGGLLALFGQCGATAISLLIGIGLAAFIWTSYRAGLPTTATLAAAPWQNWPAFAVVALLFAGGICWQGAVNPCDDLNGYYNLCEKLLATGSFDEPFSLRRLASLGGHTLLQSSVLAHASYANAQTFERGICPVILLGMILGFRDGALSRTPLGMVLALAVVTTPIFRVNSASHSTGVVLLVGLFLTLELFERQETRRLRLLAVAGLTAAALCSLRAQSIAVAGLTLGVFWLASWIKDRRSLREASIEACWWGGALFVALLPWMIMGIRSNGSPLFPLFPGGNNIVFTPQGVPGPFYARMTFPVRMLLDPNLLPLLLCLLAIPKWRRGIASHATAVAGVLASLIMAYCMNVLPYETNIPRYVQPMLLGAAAAALMAAAATPRNRMAAWAFSILLVATTFHERCGDLLNNYRALSHAEKMIMPYGTKTIADYREAQLLVPEGKRVLVCADFPYLFDHQRNDLWSIDLPNGASPAPGLPFQKPPEEMKRYFQGLGLDYVIFVDFNKSLNLYNRAIWQEHAREQTLLWKIQAPFYLDFFDTVDRLADSETKLGRVGDLTVLQLKP